MSFDVERIRIVGICNHNSTSKNFINQTPVDTSVNAFKKAAISSGIDDVGIDRVYSQNRNNRIYQAVIDCYPVVATINALEYAAISPNIYYVGI